MRTLQTIIVLLFLSLVGQTVETTSSSTLHQKDTIRHFKNQGEQEDYWATQLFEKNYVRQNYPRYSGKIVVDRDVYKYGDMTIEVQNIKSDLRDIFAKGVFYPTIITGTLPDEPKTKQQSDSLTPVDILFQNFNRPRSLTISGVEELTFLNGSPTKKRFRFLLYRRGLANPTVYFFELTNNQATRTTNLIAFINGATMTFFKEGWLMI